MDVSLSGFFLLLKKGCSCVCVPFAAAKETLTYCFNSSAETPPPFFFYDERAEQQLRGWKHLFLPSISPVIMSHVIERGCSAFAHFHVSFELSKGEILVAHFTSFTLLLPGGLEDYC